ncbi:MULTISPECIES: hypothetical protein [unclassified Cyanobium]|uniref:hypothetical protein n=1 Tax=unclassified Cyanobium TaxID=2627006 RepID=UPI0020CE718C|nr:MULTISPECIES: hypothetical protein [unclassified Cyanobium]MCP9858661.1 hypothetical protein [Cyanobium sp. Cruz-8H5]MCP9865956.1 hypothetical protein [Cyanobium sp. Cruz-8D1]
MPAGDACGENEKRQEKEESPKHTGRGTHCIRLHGMSTTGPEVAMDSNQAFPSITTSLLTELAHRNQLFGPAPSGSSQQRG